MFQISDFLLCLYLWIKETAPVLCSKVSVTGEAYMFQFLIVKDVRSQSFFLSS